jgi:hypothetical protein
MHSRVSRALLSRLDPLAVPLVVRLGKLSGWPSLETTLLIALGIGFICSAGWLLLSRPSMLQINGPLPPLLLTLIFSNALAMPMGLANFAARLAGQDIQTEEFQLLGLTHLTGRAVYQGYLFATLSRTRLLLGITLGAIPVVAAMMVEISGPAIPFGGNAYGAEWSIVFRYLCLSIGLWGLTILGIAIGTDLVLRQTHPLIVGGVASTAMLVMLIGATLGILSLFERIDSLTTIAGTPRMLLGLAVSVAAAVIPFMAFFLLLHPARSGLERSLWQRR